MSEVKERYYSNKADNTLRIKDAISYVAELEGMVSELVESSILLQNMEQAKAFEFDSSLRGYFIVMDGNRTIRKSCNINGYELLGALEHATFEIKAQITKECTIDRITIRDEIRKER